MCRTSNRHPGVLKGRGRGFLAYASVRKLGRIHGGAGHRMTGRRYYTPRLMDAAGRRRPIRTLAALGRRSGITLPWPYGLPWKSSQPSGPC